MRGWGDLWDQWAVNLGRKMEGDAAASSNSEVSLAHATPKSCEVLTSDTNAQNKIGTSVCFDADIWKAT